MAKRSAATELNHDNWNEDEEAEEAGTFRKASEAEMKGRVIKKAKRRNLPEDEKKNVFSGLSFSASAPVTADAFSFLKPKGTEEAKASFGFVFGNQKAQEVTPKPFGGFVFGGTKPVEDVKSKADIDSSKAEEDKEITEDAKEAADDSASMTKDATGEAKAATSTANDTLSTTDDATTKSEESPASAESGEKEKSNSLSQFLSKPGSWSCATCMISNPADKVKCLACETLKPGASENKPAPESKPSDLMSMFKPAVGSWTCDACMVSNPADKAKCAACETPKPGATGGGSKNELLEMFKPKAGAWSCDICMVSNKPEVVKCVACETPKPGVTITEPEKPMFSFGASGGFKFGAGSAETGGSSSGGFVFGGGPAEVKPQGDGFVFGAKAEDSGEKTGGFSFGSSSTTKDSESKTGGFTFGSATETKDSQPKTGGFTFGFKPDAQESTAGGFKFGQSTGAEKVAPGSIRFGAPSGPFGTPGGPKGAETGAAEAGTPKSGSGRRAEYLGSVKALNLQVTGWIQKHVDRNPLVDLGPVFEDYKRHMQLIRDKHGVLPKTTKVESKDGGNILEEETVLKEGTGGQEEGALYSQRCKLFYLKEGRYEERGKGLLHLKRTKENRTQLLIRVENVLGTILLNVLVTKDTALDRVGENNVLLVCVPNPVIPGEPQGPVSFLVRVKSSDIADELYDELQQAQQA